MGNGPYAARWHDYKRRRNVFLFLVLISIPFGYFQDRLLSTLQLEASRWIITLLWAVFLTIAAVWMINWRCPRCGKRFVYKYSRSPASAKWPCSFSCLRCNLPIWSSDDPDKAKST